MIERIEKFSTEGKSLVFEEPERTLHAGVIENLPRPIGGSLRTLPGDNGPKEPLELEGEPEADAAEAAVLQSRVAEAGELLRQARIIDERINASTDATKVRVVENIGHGGVKNHVQPLFHFKVFVKREVAGVRSSVTQTVTRRIAKGRIEHGRGYGRVGD